MPNYCNKTCQDCNTNFIGTNGYTKYCPDCRALKAVCPECGGHKKDIYAKTCSYKCANITKWNNSKQKKEWEDLPPSTHHKESHVPRILPSKTWGHVLNLCLT